MQKNLSDLLARIGQEYKENISDGSRFYVEVDIGKKAETLGYADLKEEFHDVNVIVPLKKPVAGMKVRIDGRTFVNYAQFDSGVVAPGYVARKAGLPYRAYTPNDSMILNFS